MRACKADVGNIENALTAYFAQHGDWPHPDEWAALVPALIPAEPSSRHYAINFDGLGRVSADPPGTTGYEAPDDVRAHPTACDNNATVAAAG